MPGHYHTMDDVSRLLRNMSGRGVDLASGKPIPVSDVETFIEESETRIDQQIRSKYTVPVVDSEGVVLLQYVASRLTGAAVWRVLQAASTQGESGKANEWERQALSLLDKISAGTVLLGDAEAASGSTAASAGYNECIEETRKWSWSDDQW